MIATTPAWGTTIPTPDGPFSLVVRADGAVLAAGWSADLGAVAARSRAAAPGLTVIDPDEPGPASAAVEAVRAYYAGDLDAPLAVPAVAQGTGFAATVRTALRAIPAGEVRRYGELAVALGSPRAARAVGGACAANAPALFVPCHRVVGASGALTGFAWGAEVKRSLLERERASRPTRGR